MTTDSRQTIPRPVASQRPQQPAELGRLCPGSRPWWIPSRAGLKSPGCVLLELKQPPWRNRPTSTAPSPKLHHIALAGGDLDVILQVRANDNIDLRRVIFDQLQSTPGVTDTQTFLVLEDTETQ